MDQTKVVSFEGKQYRVPVDATLDEIDAHIQQTAKPDVPRATQPFIAGSQRNDIPTIPKEAITPALSAGAATLTSGLSIPIQVGAQGLAGLASGAIRGGGVKGAATDAEVNMIGQTVMGNAGKLVNWLGPKVTNMGRNLWLRAAKIPEAIAKQTNTVRRGGDIVAGEREIADTVLSRGLGGNSEDNGLALVNALDNADNKLTTAIDNSTANADPRRIVRAAMKEAVKQKKGFGSGDAYQSARRVAAEIRDKYKRPTTQIAVSAKYPNAVRPSSTIVDVAEDGTPVMADFSPLKYERVPGKPAWRDVSVQEAQADKVATYKKLNYSPDANVTAGNEVRKAAARSAKEQIAAAEPAAAAANAEISQLVPAGKAFSRMRLIQSRQEPASMSKLLFGVKPSLTSGLMAVLNSPAFKTYGGQAMYNAGGRMATASALPAQQTAQALRAAIMASMRHDNK